MLYYHCHRFVKQLMDPGVNTFLCLLLQPTTWLEIFNVDWVHLSVLGHCFADDQKELFQHSSFIFCHKLQFDKFSNKSESMFYSKTMIYCNNTTYRRGLYGKLFHEYRFSSRVRFNSTKLFWISRVMKIDMSGIISHITRVIRYVVLPLSLVY